MIVQHATGWIHQFFLPTPPSIHLRIHDEYDYSGKLGVSSKIEQKPNETLKSKLKRIIEIRL